MYFKEKRIKFLHIKNIIFTIIGIFNVFVCGYYIVSEFTYYRDDPSTALHAVSMASSIVLTTIGIFLLIAAAISRSWIGSATFYSSYFEGDLDGYVTYNDLAEVTGKSVKKIKHQLRLFRRLYMRNFDLKKKNDMEIVELYSKKSLCECRSCGANIEKRIFFTGTCPYCKSSDLSSKVLTDDRFYSISNDFKSGMKKPEHYTSRNLIAKKVIFIILLVIAAAFSVIALIMMIDEIRLYFDHDYQRELLLSPENHLHSYELIKADILNIIIFDAVIILVLMPIAFLLLRKSIGAVAAGICADFFAKSRKPFVKAKNLPDFGMISDSQKKLKNVRFAIRRGYLVKCTLEMHNGELMAALAKKIVKDQCPYCAAPIVGAVDENYKCGYCGNLIMGVIEKK